MYDAIIVLANLMDPAGRLNDETCARLTKAGDLLRTHDAPLIVPCGWAYRDDSDICIADAMAAHAVRDMAIPESKILTETASRDTVGDAVFTKRNLANPIGWQRIVVVTSAYHSVRAREIFSFVYGQPIKVVAAASAETPALAASEEKSIQAFRATFASIDPGDDDAIFERLTARHPFYNGEIYPKVSSSL